MNELQKKLVDALKWFHQFCIDNNLRYFAVAGTMLGTARHKGFIPWDDDIDVGMPRPDYEKLRAIAKEHKDERYYIEFPEMNEEYYYLYAKVYDKNTTLVECARKPIKRGIYIDIFPFDGAGESMDEAKKIYKPIAKKINLDAMITCDYSKRRKSYKNFGVFVGRLISPLFIKRQKNAKEIERLCVKLDYENSKIVGNLYSYWGAKEIMLKEIIGEVKEYPFEDTVIFGVANPHEYLTNLYGDYMQLPPVEKRVSHHDHLLFDLDKSYLKD